jgi:LPS export ABC transporter protein LptC
MNKTRLVLIASILVVTGIIVVFNYSDTDVKIHPSFQTSSMKNLLLIRKDNNEVKWELSADEAIIPEKKENIYLRAVSLKINKSPEVYLTSGTGSYSVENEHITLNNPVELHMQDKKFITHSLTWSSKDELITTRDPVQFTGENFVINGTGLEAQIKQQNVTITNNVKAIFYH